MTHSTHLGLPYLEKKERQKHVHHNEALRILDALVMLAALDRTRSAPPESPGDGDRHIVAAGATGAFAGHEDEVAAWLDGAWSFLAPRTGWLCYVIADDAFAVWTGGSWEALSGASAGSELQNLTLLGIGTEADAANPVSARINNALWAAREEADGGDGTLRWKLSKESAEKNLSFLFQDDFEGCAEIGLTGDDDFHFKVSPDGEDWIDALLIDRASGAVKANAGLFVTGALSPDEIVADCDDYDPAGLAGAAVLRLHADAPRSVTGLSGGGPGRVVVIVNAGSQPISLTDADAGSDAHNRFDFGDDVALASRQSALLWYDGASSRWRLLAGPQAAGAGGGGGGAGRELLGADRTYYVRSDGSDSNDGLADSSGGAFLTVQKAVDVIGTLDLSVYDVTVQLGSGTFAGAAVSAPFIGGPGSSVSIVGNTGSAGSHVLSSAILVLNGAALRVRGLDFTSSGYGIDIQNGGSVLVDGAVIFGACTNSHIHLINAGRCEVTSNYTIDGGAPNHVNCNLGSVFLCNGRTITLSGTPAWSSVGHVAADLAAVRVQGNTYSGSATGPRYFCGINGTINTNSGGASYLPGNSAGTAMSGGQYV